MFTPYTSRGTSAAHVFSASMGLIWVCYEEQPAVVIWPVKLQTTAVTAHVHYCRTLQKWVTCSIDTYSGSDAQHGTSE
jgi:hypothetical protein